MTSYKHLVENNNNMLRRLTKFSGVCPDLVQRIMWFTQCMAKQGQDLIDYQIFSVVMSTYMGVTDQNSVRKIFIRLGSKKKKCLTKEQFAAVLCSYFSSSLDVHIEYVFKMFDANDDGTIDFPEIETFLKSCRVVTDMDEADKDETQVDLRTMVFDCLQFPIHDGITLEAFRAKVKENPLCLSMLGQTMPTRLSLENFRNMVLGKSNLQIKQMFRNIRSDLLFEPPDTSTPKYYPIELDIP